MRSRSWLAPVSDAVNSPASIVKPNRRRSRQTRSAPPEESMPRTFSMRTNQAPLWTMMRLASLQRSRSSSSPRRFPARECGWHGMPPMTPSTRPCHGRPSKVVTSLHTGASARRPCCIAATRWPMAKASLSTSTTGRASGIASSKPISSPPPPVQRLMRLRDWGRRATFTSAPSKTPHTAATRPSPPARHPLMSAIPASSRRPAHARSP